MANSGGMLRKISSEKMPTLCRRSTIRSKKVKPCVSTASPNSAARLSSTGTRNCRPRYRWSRLMGKRGDSIRLAPALRAVTGASIGPRPILTTARPAGFPGV